MSGLICHRRHHDDDKSTGATDRQAAERFEAIATTNVVRAKSRGANAARQRHSGAQRLSARRAGIRLSGLQGKYSGVRQFVKLKCSVATNRRTERSPASSSEMPISPYAMFTPRAACLYFRASKAPHRRLISWRPPLHCIRAAGMSNAARRVYRAQSTLSRLGQPTGNRLRGPPCYRGYKNALWGARTTRSQGPPASGRCARQVPANSILTFQGVLSVRPPPPCELPEIAHFAQLQRKSAEAAPIQSVWRYTYLRMGAPRVAMAL